MTIHLNRWAWLFLLTLIGCDTSNETFSAPQTEEQIDFGDPYVIASGDRPPLLDIEALQLTVQYSGGCIHHDFAVRSRLQSDTTIIWLHHNSKGDLCEAYLTDSLSLLVPQAAQGAKHVVLLGPEDRTFTLR